MLKPVWKRTFNSGVVYVEFFPKIFVLGVGLSGGVTLLFKVNVREEGQELVEKMTDLDHNKDVVGIALDYSRGYVYLYSRCNYLSMFEINYKSKIKDVTLFKAKVIAARHNYEAKNTVVLDDQSNIWIVGYENNEPNLYKKVNIQSMGEISLFEVNFVEEMGMIAFRDGSFTVFEVKYGSFHLQLSILKEHSTKDGRFVVN